MQGGTRATKERFMEHVAHEPKHFLCRKSPVPKDTVLAVASALDQERCVSGKRGPLHGIPIVHKVGFSRIPAVVYTAALLINHLRPFIADSDNISTPSIGLPTACGSYALVGASANKDATITQRLVKAGAPIIKDKHVGMSSSDERITA